MRKSDSIMYSFAMRMYSAIGAANIRKKSALALCLVSCGVFSASSWGQSADSNQPGPDSDPPAGVTSSAQPGQGVNGPRKDDTYIIGDDDVLSINVWKEQELTRVVTVRSDGRISLPLAGEVQAAGQTPPQLEQEITNRLRGFITDPQVTVIVQEIRSQKFNILGQVLKPGSYPFTTGTTVVDAIATAGGFKDFAKKKGIYILRQNSAGGQTKIFFNYEKFIKGKNTAQNIQLKPRDMIIVP